MVWALAAVTPKSSATASIGAAIFDVSINCQVRKFSCFIQINPPEIQGAKLSLTVRGPARNEKLPALGTEAGSVGLHSRVQMEGYGWTRQVYAQEAVGQQKLQAV